MKIYSLYEYIVLTHYMNFTTAANNLHTSQPNLSKHLLEIEQELGVELIKRGKKLELTPAGTAFLEDAIQIHHMYKDAVRLTREIAAHDTVELLIQEPYVMDDTSEILLKSLVQFKRENPYVVTKYYSETGKKSIELLEQKKIDIALVVECNSAHWIEKASETKSLIFYPLIRERLYVWMRDNHPLLRQDEIVLDDLLAYPINMTATRRFDPMRYAIIDLFQKNLGQHPNLRTYSNDSLNEFFTNTQDRNAVFLVSESVANSQMLNMHTDMTSVLLNDSRAKITTYLLFRADYQKGAIDDFLDVLEKTVETRIEKNPNATYLSDIEFSY